MHNKHVDDTGLEDGLPPMTLPAPPPWDLWSRVLFGFGVAAMLLCVTAVGLTAYRVANMPLVTVHEYNWDRGPVLSPQHPEPVKS